MPDGRPRRQTSARALACAGLLWLVTGSAEGQDADSLLARARSLARSPDLHMRLQAARDLAEAARLAPGNPEIWRELSAVQMRLHQREQARRSLTRLAVLTPDDAHAWSRLGDAWRWDWLATIDDSSFARALRCYARATRLDPTKHEAWLGRAGMTLAKGDLRGSRAAAEGAIACAPDAAMSQLAFACVAYRAGALQLAEGAFDVAVPRLPPEYVARFHGVAASQSRSASHVLEGDSDSTIVWSDRTAIPDPDLTTAVNEAALDYQFRVGLALLLLRREDGLSWDMRSELIARYGLPAEIREPAPDQELVRRYWLRKSPDEAVQVGPDFPYHFQLWRYPALGMDAPLWDLSLLEHYESPPDLEHATDPRPDYRRLRGRSDLMIAADGLAVFRTMAPGVTPIPLTVLVSRFPSVTGARLVAYVSAAAGPQDTLWASMTVSDRDGHRVASAEGRMGRSLCDPSERQLAQLSEVVPPGLYRVDLSVRFGVRRRGLVRARTQVATPEPGLRMGDVVLLCGPTELQTSGSVVRLEPDFGRRIVGQRDVSVYFELSQLATGPDGQRSFRYTYAIHALDVDGSEVGPALVEASRTEHYAGDDRRQFITAKAAALKPGRYRLRIDVQDEVGGGGAFRTMDFQKVAAGS